MAEFLKNAGPDQILILIALLLLGAIIFVGVMFFSLAKPDKGQKKKKRKAQSKKSTDLNLDLLSSKVDREIATMDEATRKQAPQDEIDWLARLGNRPPAVPPPDSEKSVLSNSAKKPSNPATDLSEPASEPIELLCLLRDPQSGQLIVEIGGRRYTKLADIVDKEIGQYILRLVAHLLAFTNGMIATDAGVKSTYMPKLGAVPQPPPGLTRVSQSPSQTSIAVPSSYAPQPSPLSPPPEVEAAFLASLHAQPLSPPEAQPPQRSGFFGRSKPVDKTPSLLSLNLAEEINKIVQARLMYSPLAATTSLDIVADPTGGIRIKVNGTFYSSPDDIPNPEVKALIKASIKQWEKS